MKILSGIQPSGQLHIGNYFGMMKPMIQNMDRGELYAFVVNFHAMTSVQDSDLLSRDTLNAAADFLALGLDPERCIFWVQSDVPEVTELTWILSTLTPMGLAGAVPFLQGQNRQGHSRQPWALLLSGTDGG